MTAVPVIKTKTLSQFDGGVALGGSNPVATFSMPHIDLANPIT